MDDGYDVLDGRELMRREDAFAPRKIAYPPRLMVDFTRIGMQALQRYARVYGLKVDGACEQAELAALVARHFDAALEVEEHESIAAFVQRLRNGERSASKRPADKDRKAAADKKRKKSSSHKRGRDASASTGGAHAGGAGNGHAAGGAHHHAAPEPPAASSHHDKSSSSSSAAAAAPSKSNKRGGSKKKDDEDNELYCVCNLPSYGNMIACDGKKCPNPSQWYHLECVGLADGRHPDTWLCPECDPKGFAAFQSKKKKPKHRSKSPGASK